MANRFLDSHSSTSLTPGRKSLAPTLMEKPHSWPAATVCRAAASLRPVAPAGRRQLSPLPGGHHHSPWRKPRWQEWAYSQEGACSVSLLLCARPVCCLSLWTGLLREGKGGTAVAAFLGHWRGTWVLSFIYRRARLKRVVSKMLRTPSMGWGGNYIGILSANKTYQSPPPKRQCITYKTKKLGDYFM